MELSEKLKNRVEALAFAPFSRLEKKERDRRLQERLKRREQKNQNFN